MFTAKIWDLSNLYPWVFSLAFWASYKTQIPTYLRPKKKKKTYVSFYIITQQTNLRGIKLDETVAQRRPGVGINRHPKSSLLDNAKLAVNLLKDILEFLKLGLGNNGEVIDHDYIAEPCVEF